MPFNIREIKASINRANGIYRPSHFMVLMPTRQVGDEYVDIQVLALHASGIVAPGLNLMTSDVVHRGYGISERRPYQAQTNDITITFRVDGNYDIPNFFYRWMKRISGFTGTIERSTNADLFEYPDNYVTDFNIEQYDASGDVINTYTISRAYPISAETMQLDWGAQNQVGQFTVQFAFETWSTDMIEE